MVLYELNRMIIPTIKGNASSPLRCQSQRRELVAMRVATPRGAMFAGVEGLCGGSYNRMPVEPVLPVQIQAFADFPDHAVGSGVFR